MKKRNWYNSKLEVSRLFFGVLFYNKFCNFDYVLDICITPLYRFVDNYVSVLGPAFVITCGSVMLTVIIMAYWIGLPYWWNKSPVFTIFLLIVGNWLLMNAVFHFYMGIVCDPGHPVQKSIIKEASGVCKKCIMPKPQRTHHCSICKTCILLMDHHCPWLNNCVGHYNRRYFFLYMVYIVFGVIFLMIFGVEIAYKEVWLREFPIGSNLDGYSVLLNTTAEEKNISKDSVNILEYSVRRRCIIFTALMCVGTFIALGLLMLRHIRLISRGETTIEMYINQSQTELYKKRNKVYINPYNYGTYKNWILFLGIFYDSGRTWKHILFPSTHKPFGDGFAWPYVNSDEPEWVEFFHQKHS